MVDVVVVEGQRREGRRRGVKSVNRIIMEEARVSTRAEETLKEKRRGGKALQQSTEL